MVTNIPRTYEKLQCKEEQYRFSNQRDPLGHTDTQKFCDYSSYNFYLTDGKKKEQ